MDKSCLCWQYVKSCQIQRHNCRHTSCQLLASECILFYVSPRKWQHTATVPMGFSRQKSIYSRVLVFKITWHKNTNHIWEKLKHRVLRMPHNIIFEKSYTIPHALIRSITVSMFPLPAIYHQYDCCIDVLIIFVLLSTEVHDLAPLTLVYYAKIRSYRNMQVWLCSYSISRLSLIL